MKSPRQIAASLRRNGPILRDLIRFAVTDSPEARKRIAGWLEPRLLEARTPVRKCFKGKALMISEDEGIASHLSRLEHLGVLARLTPYSLTRQYYADTQAELLLEVKEKYNGIGLGSRLVAHDRTSLDISTLELAQIWATLSSYGHLFGTFATERALQFQLYALENGRDELLNLCSPAHRELLRPIVDSNSMYSFVKVLTSIRIHHMLSGEVREVCEEAWRLYCTPLVAPKVARSRHIYEVVRKVAYLRLHARCGVPGSPSDVILSSAVAALFDHAAISFSESAKDETPLAKLIRATDFFHYETFFTSPRAAATVLQHIRQFKHWWHKRHAEGDSVLTRIISLAAEPSDWPASDSTSESLNHIARIQLPCAERDWITEADRWWAAGYPWTNGSNFFLSIAPNAGTGFVDIYSATQFPSSEAALHVSERLASACENTWSSGNNEESNRIIWKSCATWLLSLFSLCLAPGIRLRLTPLSAAGAHAGLSAISSAYSRLEAHMTEALLPHMEDRARADELSSALAAAPLYFDEALSGPWLFCLGKLELLNDENIIVGEIDGLIGVHSGRSTRWLAIECKGGNRVAGANGQIAKLARLLPGALIQERSNTRIDGQKIRSLLVEYPLP